MPTSPSPAYDAHGAQVKNGLIFVAGHAIYRDGVWYGGFPGEHTFYEEHVRAGFQLRRDLGYEYIVLTGGATRPQLAATIGGRSEAEGMKDYAIEAGLCSADDATVLVEPMARDSFENVFYSVLAFMLATGRWPSRIGIVSWNSKGLRFHLIASGMGLGGRVFFHGVGDYATQADLERGCAAEAVFNSGIVNTKCIPPAYQLEDPLLRSAQFARKRWSRMPSIYSPDAAGNSAYVERVKAIYAGNSPTARDLIAAVEACLPGDAWRHVHWAWALGVPDGLLPNVV